MRPGRWEELTQQEKDKFWAQGGGFHPKLQDEYFEIFSPENKSEYEYCRQDIWGRLINLDGNLTILGSILENLKFIDHHMVTPSQEAQYVVNRIAWAVYGECIVLVSTLLYDASTWSRPITEPTRRMDTQSVSYLGPETALFKTPSPLTSAIVPWMWPWPT